MAPVFASRRRAVEFAALVEGNSSEAGERYAHLLELVGQLQAVPARTPSHEFVADLRARLMAEADTALVPVTARERAETDRRLSLPARRTSRDGRVAGALGSLAFVGAAAAITVGAQVALPGDTLYPVKRAIEDVRTEIAVGEDDTGTLMLAHASERLGETAALTRRAELDVPATETGLRDFTAQATGGAVLLTSAYAAEREPATIVRLRDFTGDSMEDLAALEPSLPPEARDELYAAAEAMITIDDEATSACRACGGAGIDTLPPNLLSSAPSPFDPGALAGLPVPGAGGGGGGDQANLPGPLSTLVPEDPTSVPTPRSGGRVPTGSAPVPTVPTLLVPTVPVPVPSAPVPSAPLPSAPVPTPKPTPKPTPRVPTPTLPTATPSPPKLPTPTILPTTLPTVLPTALPTILPTLLPTVSPTVLLTILPTLTPSLPVGSLPPVAP